jgi:hypothetical protein
MPNRQVVHKETISIYVWEESMTHINTFCGQNEEIFYITPGGIYTTHYAWKRNSYSKEVTDE